MEENDEHAEQKKKRDNWSRNRFAWVYAILIFILALGYAITLYLSNIYESRPWRIFNILFIVLGFVLLLWDYLKVKEVRMGYIEAFKFCLRCGIYFTILFVPAVLVFLSLDTQEIKVIQNKETYGSDLSLLEMTFSVLIETVTSILIAAFVAAFKGIRR